MFPLLACQQLAPPWWAGSLWLLLRVGGCVYLYMYWGLDGPRPGTVCDFRGCDAPVRTCYIKRDVGWRNEVKDFRCAEPDLFFLEGGVDNFAAVHSLSYNPDLLSLIFLCLCRNVSELWLCHWQFLEFLFELLIQHWSSDLSVRWTRSTGLHSHISSHRSVAWELKNHQLTSVVSRRAACKHSLYLYPYNADHKLISALD